MAFIPPYTFSDDDVLYASQLTDAFSYVVSLGNANITAISTTIPNVAQYGAMGDGRKVTVVSSILKNSTTLNVSTSTFLPTDVSKTIVIHGAGSIVGSLGSALTANISSVISTKSVVISIPAITGISNVSIEFDIGTDDTEAFHNALTSLPIVSLTSGSVYLVKNITLPSFQPKGSMGFAAVSGIVCPFGMATIRAIGGGDTSYLAASLAWINDSKWSALPAIYQNIAFDGNNIVQDVVIPRSYATIWNNIHIMQGLRYGLSLSKVSRNNIAITSGQSFPNNVFNNIQIYKNGSHGFYNDNGSDAEIVNGYIFNNGGWGLYSTTCGGWLISKVHTYSNLSGGMLLAGWGYSSSINQCIFEESPSLELLSLESQVYLGQIGPGNNFWGQVKCMFTDNLPGGTIRIESNIFTGKGTVYQAYNSGNHIVLSSNNIFGLNTIPYTWNGNQLSKGIIYANNDSWINSDSINGIKLLNGLQTPSSPNIGNGFNHIEKYKNLNQGVSTTTWTITIHVYNVLPAGFTGTGEIHAWTLDSFGINIERFVCDIRILYSRDNTFIAPVYKANISNKMSTASGPTIDITIGEITQDLSNNAYNIITFPIEIYHVIPNATIQKSGTMIKFDFVNQNSNPSIT